MKNFTSLFYIMPTKIVIFLLIFLFSFLFAETQVNFFALYNIDKTAFQNVMKQNSDYDFLTSVFYRHEIERSIDCVVELCMKHSEIFSLTDSEREDYLSHTETSLNETIAFLKESSGLTFALVNHDKKTVFSFDESLNGLDSNVQLREYFNGDETNLLIVRNCKSPYIESGTMQGFNEYIIDVAKDYEDDFDLYIFSGDSEDIRLKGEQCLKRHNRMLEKFEMQNTSSVIYSVVMIMLSALLVVVSGKSEPGGKIRPGETDKIYNDLLFCIFGIVLVCIASLFKTSLYMIIQINDVDPEFWLGIPVEFYLRRAKMCICIFIMTVVITLCSFKKQRHMGTLLTNTYVYKVYKFHWQMRKNHLSNK